MAKITVDFTKTIGKVKPMHAVNNGPVRPARMFSKSGNFEKYQALCLPYARNHDAAFCASYGGQVFYTARWQAGVCSIGSSLNGWRPVAADVPRNRI